ncbi:MAG: lycopene cyclase domain-containing protein [Ignavibacteriae bacterium]|nr:lycopene cyclase domain-containing protein [Ignavibacteriota bacterium]MCB9217311.1 lycopene cyclase domain-containing protein [Ignavibacteria bacterium]
MTYLEFHLIFNLPLLLLLLFFTRKKLSRGYLKWVAVVCLIVLTFTFPWDSWAVAKGIWGFGEERVLFKVGNLPFEEVLFFLLETIAVALLVILFLPKRGGEEG